MVLLKAFMYLLLLVLCNQIAEGVSDYYSIQKDLDEYNITCNEEKCATNRIDSLSTYSCHCGIQCIQLGTCCVESYYYDAQQPKLKPGCRSVNGRFYFMVDHCPTDSAMSSLCNDEWSGDGDLQAFVPVTSLLTSITYKNFYCFRCHESSEEFIYWNLQIKSNFVEDENTEDIYGQSAKRISLTYYKEMNTWMAIYDEDMGYFPVNLTVQVPNEIYKYTHDCESNLISDCADNWRDEDVRNKCQSYMAIRDVKNNGVTRRYKNIHCALCNFESLSDISCKEITFVGLGGAKVPFSFTFLLDINRSDGEFVGKKEKCSENQVWDPYTKKCRTLTCAIPGSKIKNGKCVQE